MTTHVVIMAGGVGSRLFPISTPEHPKQFIDLLGCGRTMIQLTRDRFAASLPDAVFWVVTSARYAHFVREQLPDIPEDRILCEPQARNTAPAIAYACWKISRRWKDANIIVTPSDAYVPDVRAFGGTVLTALDFTASVSAVVCIGIRPTGPHTGYGYIKSPGGEGVVKVDSFKEKPSLEVARKYLSEGCYSWNAGIFIWTAATIEAEMRAHAPQIAGIMDRLAPTFYTPGESAALNELFPLCEKISIDYAVMEKSTGIYTISADWFWSDLGSLEALDAVLSGLEGDREAVGMPSDEQ